MREWGGNIWDLDLGLDPTHLPSRVRADLEANSDEFSSQMAEEIRGFETVIVLGKKGVEGDTLYPAFKKSMGHSLAGGLEEKGEGTDTDTGRDTDTNTAASDKDLPDTLWRLAGTTRANVETMKSMSSVRPGDFVATVRYNTLIPPRIAPREDEFFDIVLDIAYYCEKWGSNGLTIIQAMV